MEKIPAGLGYLLGKRGGLIVIFGLFLIYGGYLTKNLDLQNIGVWIFLVGLFLFGLLSLISSMKHGKWKAF